MSIWFNKKSMRYWRLGILLLILLGISACTLSAEIILPLSEKEIPSHRKITLLIPSPGDSYDQQIERGVELAIDEFNRNSATPQISLWQETPFPEPQILRETIRKLAADEKVIAVIGPLFLGSTVIAAQEAEEMKLPLITLTSSQEEIPGMGDYVFRNALTPGVQVQTILHYGLEEGYHSFAIFYPDTPYGHSLKEEFKKQVKKSGGEIIFEQSYQEGKTDYQDEIIKIGGTNIPLLKSRDSSYQRPLPPAYDAIYLPGSPRELVLIVPQLRFQDIDVPILGADRWQNEYLLRWGEKTLEGAVFTSGFFINSSWPSVQQFSEQFRNQHKMDPTLLTALGYDTAKIILQGIIDGNYQREELRHYLTRLQNFPGVTGETTFKNGELEKKVPLLMVEKNKFVQIN